MSASRFGGRSPVAIGALFLFSLLLAGGCAKEEPKRAAPTPAVKVITVAPRDIAVSNEYVAQTQSSQAVNIQARVSGFLDKRTYTEGSVVKTGQILFRMDPKPFQAQVDGAKAALQRNQAAFDVAKASLDRTKPLVQAEALSQKDLDDAQGQYEQTAAAVEQSKSQLVEAQLNLSYTIIRSPVDGVSSYAAIADGTYVSPQNSQLTTVSVLTPMWINFSISENEMERIRADVKRGTLKLPEGGKFDVEIELVDGTRFPQIGRITFADPSYSSTTGTFLLRATVDNPTGALHPNQYVRARILGATRPNAIVVPQRAVQQGAKGHFVWVVNKQSQAELRPVTVGDWYGDGWFIASGLAAGDQVVVDGGVRLAQGVTVQAAPYVAPAVEPQANATTRPPGAAPSGTQRPGTAIHFPPGMATLDDQAALAIRATASSLIGIGTAVSIASYAERGANAKANTELAKRRAAAVRDALIQAGVQARRIEAKAPVEIPASTSDDRLRRVDITVGP